MLDEERLIELLKQTSKMLEYLDENKFKIAAYTKAADIIESYDGKFFELYNSGQYKNIAGIGKGMQEFITEFFNTNTTNIYEELKKKTPKEFFELLKIKGLGIKKIKSVYGELNIETVKSLEENCLNGQLLNVKGISEKFCNDILNEISRLKRDNNKILLSKADNIVKLFNEEFSKAFPNIRLHLTGELRRNCEVISMIEYLVVINDLADFLKTLSEAFDVVNTETIDYYTQVIINYNNKFNIYLYITNNNENFVRTNFYKTGSSNFVKSIINKGQNINFTSEESVFKSLGYKYLKPELRENETLEYLDKLDFENSVNCTDIKALIHFHTNWSDGLASIEEMSSNAINFGLQYFVVSDHSKTPVYANGLSEKRVLAQKEEIEILRKDKNLKLFCGIESDILPDGNLDYDEDFLNSFDYIIASVHSKFDLSKPEMTNRIIKAIENPYTDVIGHVSGRILLRRNPYEIDIFKVLDACAVNDVAIEINASPSRLDLDWRYIYYARERGVKFCINPDAHSISEIEMIKYGIKVAQKAGIKAEEIINCLNIEEFIKHINRKVNRKVTWSKNGLERVN